MQKIARMAFLFLLALTMAVPAAVGNDESPSEEGKTIEGITNESHIDGETRAPIYWDFITCTHTSHECSHEAWYHGYHHYKAVYHPHHCGSHMPYECYGGHHK